jgi:hypothetical protein
MKIADFASPYSPLFSSLGFLLLLKLLSFPGFNSFVCCPASMQVLKDYNILGIAHKEIPLKGLHYCLVG